MIVVLDDDKLRHQCFQQAFIGHPAKHVYTVSDAIKAIEERSPRLLFLDHDLDLLGVPTEVSGTGMDVVRYLVDHARAFARSIVIVVHSLNPVYAPEMVRALSGAGYKVFERPFAWEDEDALDYFMTRAGA